MWYTLAPTLQPQPRLPADYALQWPVTVLVDAGAADSETVYTLVRDVRQSCAAGHYGTLGTHLVAVALDTTALLPLHVRDEPRRAQQLLDMPYEASLHVNELLPTLCTLRDPAWKTCIVDGIVTSLSSSPTTTVTAAQQAALRGSHDRVSIGADGQWQRAPSVGEAPAVALHKLMRYMAGSAALGLPHLVGTGLVEPLQIVVTRDAATAIPALLAFCLGQTHARRPAPRHLWLHDVVSRQFHPVSLLVQSLGTDRLLDCLVNDAAAADMSSSCTQTRRPVQHEKTGLWQWPKSKHTPAQQRALFRAMNCDAVAWHLPPDWYCGERGDMLYDILDTGYRVVERAADQRLGWASDDGLRETVVIL